MLDKNNYWDYIESDFYRWKGHPNPSIHRTWLKERILRWRITIYALFGRNISFSFTFWLRIASIPHANKSILLPVIKIAKLKIYHERRNCDILASTKIGYGLMIAHLQSIVINGNAVIGDNVMIQKGLNVGSAHNKIAVIGDNVYIGPNVCIVEDVKIGNNATIGAGAIVIDDVPANATVAGNPAKIISYKDHTDMRIHPYPIENNKL